MDSLLKNIDFTDKQLDEKVVCRDLRHTTNHDTIERKQPDKEMPALA